MSVGFSYAAARNARMIGFDGDRHTHRRDAFHHVRCDFLLDALLQGKAARILSHNAREFGEPEYLAVLRGANHADVDIAVKGEDVVFAERDKGNWSLHEMLELVIFAFAALRRKGGT